MGPFKSNEIKPQKHMKDCCHAKKGICIRTSDKTPFDLTNRRYTKKECETKPIKGFTMKSSCAPYKDCK
jgi:hypothetical protein